MTTWKRFHPAFHFLTLALIAAVGLLVACESGNKGTGSNGTNGGPHDLPGGATAEVAEATGSTLTTSGGIELIITPAALPGDTTVSIIPVDLSGTDGRIITGARMEPDGLILDSAVVVRFPLPSDWDGDDEPVVYEFKGDDPTTAVPTGAYARVTGSAGAYFAEVLVSHFSGVLCEKNCHAGTIRNVLDHFAAKGCNEDSVLARVGLAYPGVNIPPPGKCGARGVETVQAVLDTYFDDIGGYNDGQDIPADLRAQMTAHVQAGRKVVLAFKPGAWGQRGGTHNFYPTAVTQYAHTAALEMKDGQVQIRNSLATKDTALIRILNGNTVWYPFDKVNEFRQLPQGVATEIQICGAPDCLSDPSLNPHGIAPYNPIAGRSYWGRAWSDPWTYMLSEGQWSGISPRGIPWTAVRIYVQKVSSPINDLCPDETTENTMTATVSLQGHPGPFAPTFVLGALGSLNDVPGFPGIDAYTGNPYDPEALLKFDFFRLFLNKGLATGTYGITGDPWEGGQAMLFFTTPHVKHADSGWPVTFAATSGTFTLTSYSEQVGGRLTGTFSASISGDQEVTGSDEPEYVTVTGSISGSFDAEIAASGGAARIVNIGSDVTLKLALPIDRR